MMKKVICILCLSLLAVNTSFATTYKVGYDKKILNVKKGDKIVVVLSENPTTGYSWLMSVSNPKDTYVLEELNKKFYSSNSKLLGASGCIHYTVKANRKGKAYIEGINTRPWEKNGDEAIYKLEVIVK